MISWDGTRQIVTLFRIDAGERDHECLYRGLLPNDGNMTSSLPFFWGVVWVRMFMICRTLLNFVSWWLLNINYPL